MAHRFENRFITHMPPKVLIITSPKASKATYDFCDEIVGMFLLDINILLWYVY